MIHSTTLEHGGLQMDDYEIEHIDEKDRYVGINSMEYVNSILEKIKQGDDAKIEHKGRRPIRELLQNSDDAGAGLLVLRFDEDRLWLYNDGQTMDRDYLDALAKLGGASKKEQADTSGSFGTGFRSTHMFTDTPEIEWIQFIGDKLRVDSRYLPMSIKPWADIPERKKMSKPDFMKCPKGFENRDSLGIFFSFPWRKENNTGHSEFDKYIWGSEQIEILAKEIKHQAPKMLIGCRNIKKIRVVLTCAKSSEDNFIFEVENDINLTQIKSSETDNGETKISEFTLQEENKFSDLNSSKSWQRKNHEWYSEKFSPKGWRRSKTLDVSVNAYHWCKKPIYNKSDILDNKGNIVVELKRYWNLCIIFFPTSISAEKLPRYTPIPLGGVSDEYFGIVSFCPPAEDRRTVYTGDSNERKYAIDITNAAIELYSSNIYAVVKKIATSDKMVSSEKEKLITKLLPRSSASTWISPALSGDVQETQKHNGRGTTGDLWSALEKVVRYLSIACIGGEMKLLGDTIHTISQNGGNLD